MKKVVFLGVVLSVIFVSCRHTPAMPVTPEPSPEIPSHLLELPHQFIEHKASQEWAESDLKIDPQEIINSDVIRNAPKYYIGSSKKEFWIQDKDNNWQQIRATLQGQSNHSNIWIADSSFSYTLNDDNSDYLLTQQQAADLAKKFEAIYRPMTNLFGFEFGGGPKGNGGLDADPRIQILVYDIADCTGFFWEKDEYNGDIGEKWHSNMCEILYLDAPELDKNPEYMYTGMIHVFQYLINFNEKKLRLNKPIDRWYDGMLSEMAADVIAPYLGITWSHPAHVIQNELRHYVKNNDKVELSEWKYGNLHYDYYAQACAFGAYLTRNFGGVSLVRDIMRNNEVNLASIDAALLSRGSSYNDARARFHEVLEYSTSTGMPQDVYSFDRTVKTKIGSVDYTFYGFDIFNVSLVEIKAKYVVPELKDKDNAESYMVKAGDQLTSIANKHYGRGGGGYYFPLIMLASSFEIPNPDLINKYKKLTIPKLDLVHNDGKIKENVKGYFHEVETWYEKNRPEDTKTLSGIRQAAERL
ncbi:hypothetical protein AGMMS49991_06330 [Spirochaetia bacterium]|nr:hypothetical protein AGMMS49991_06330 [Spirochaetia bacterium]